MRLTKKRGLKLGKSVGLHRKSINYFPRFLAPSFLTSLGAAGYVGYAFAQTRAIPSSPNVSFLHLIGVAGTSLVDFCDVWSWRLRISGGFGISFWITAVHGKWTVDRSIAKPCLSLLGRTVQRMLSRHEFATVQSHLSSVYFSSSTILASLSLGTFLLRHPLKTWSSEATNLVRITTLSDCFV